MKNLKKFLLLLVCFSAVLFQPLAQSYYITEDQLQQLENNLAQQQMQIETLQTQLNNAQELLILANTQLKESQAQTNLAQKSLTQLEQSSSLKIWIAGGSCLVIGGGIGALTAWLLTR